MLENTGRLYSLIVTTSRDLERLERRIDDLRAAVRRAVMAGDRAKARELRAELRQAEEAWEDALAAYESAGKQRRGRDLPDGDVDAEPAGDDDAESPGVQATPTRLRPAPAPLLPLREHVHHALTLLTVPAAPRLIVAVHQAFFTGDMVPARLTSLRRDEENSFRSAPNARPYYICAALTADRLTPARGLLAVSTWTMAERIVAPLSSRVHYLTSAIKVAEYMERIEEVRPEAARLLWRFAANIPGAAEGEVRPDVVKKAAAAELVIHAEADQRDREEAAARAARLSPAEQLFGSRGLQVVSEDVG